MSRNLRFLLSRRGREATLNIQSTSSYDTATSRVSGGLTPYTVKAYFSQYNLSESETSSTTEGTRWVLLSDVDTSGNTIPKPNTKSNITGVGQMVTINDVQEIRNGESLVCYLCEVRE